jgi:signal transduction histidine kinase
VITVTVVVNMREVENEAKLIGNGYMRLTLGVKDVTLREDELFIYIKDNLVQARTTLVAQQNLKRLRAGRDDALKEVMPILDSLDYLADVDPRTFATLRPKIEALQAAAVANDSLYKQVLTASSLIGDDNPTVTNSDGIVVGVGTRRGSGPEAVKALMNGERIVYSKSNSLAADLHDLTLRRISQVQDNQLTIRARTIYLGIVAVLLGLLITIWVVITLRPLRRLRDGARRVAAGDYGARLREVGPTEVAELAREFNAMGAAVQERERELVRSERLAAVGTMAAVITHEVRNPLSSISLNTELLGDELAGAPHEAEARELIRAITTEVDRLTAITEEYLSFARLPKPKIVPESVNTMVGALAAFVREDLSAKKVQLSLELSSADPIALVDAAQMRQCLINLVRNGVDAVVSKGGGTVRIKTSRVGARVEIAVADDGVGIPPELLSKLFDPFFSTKDGGSGLGLALTQQIVKDHGGELRVTSSLGVGTTFTVSVPANA